MWLREGTSQGLNQWERGFIPKAEEKPCVVACWLKMDRQRQEAGLGSHEVADPQHHRRGAGGGHERGVTDSQLV